MRAGVYKVIHKAVYRWGCALGSKERADIEMNVGFFPEEGKYNRTACTRCYEQYTLAQAEEFRWRCPKDRGLIKKGVRDRARELSSGTPVKRPPYLHILPLGEIIRITENASSTTTKKCIATYTADSFRLLATRLRS